MAPGCTEGSTAPLAASLPTLISVLSVHFKASVSWLGLLFPSVLGRGRQQWCQRGSYSSRREPQGFGWDGVGYCGEGTGVPGLTAEVHAEKGRRRQAEGLDSWLASCSQLGRGLSEGSGQVASTEAPFSVGVGDSFCCRLVPLHGMKK